MVNVSSEAELVNGTFLTTAAANRKVPTTAVWQAPAKGFHFPQKVLSGKIVPCPGLLIGNQFARRSRVSDKG